MGDRQLLSEQWMRMALTPTGGQSPYGFINYQLTPTASSFRARRRPRSCITATALDMIYVDPEHDLVAVVRWIDNAAADGFVKRLIAAMAEKS